MTSLSQKAKKIQLEEVSKKRPVGESTVQKIGGSVNYIIGQSASQLGDIQESVLDLAAFQSIHGSGWVLADGQNIVGSELANLTGYANAPDMRASFQRMKDHGRGLDIERDLIDEQTSDVKSHSHILLREFDGGGGTFTGTTVLNTSSLSGTVSTRAQGSSIEPTFMNLIEEGGSESRPINISFYIYIKINN